MKIKLQDYSIISNEWVDEEIESFKQLLKELKSKKIINPEYVFRNNIRIAAIESKIQTWTKIKQQLIPSEKLASVCYDAGIDWDGAYDYNIDKEDFLTSEIEIL